MASERLVRPETAERAGQNPQFRDIRRKHLQHCIGEAEFENRACNHGEKRLLPDHDAAPRLLAARVAGVIERVRVIRRKAGREVQTIDSVFDLVRAAGSHALHLHGHGEAVARRVFGAAEQNRVVVCLAGGRAAMAVRSVWHQVRELRAHGLGENPQPEGQVLRVDAEIAHAAVSSVCGKRSLPVDGLLQVHVGRVADGEPRLDDPAEFPRLVPLHHLLRRRIIGKFARAADKNLGVLRHSRLDLPEGRKVDAERLFRKEVLARADDLRINLRMLVVRHRAVDGLHLGIGQQLTVVVIEILRVGVAAEPVEIRVRAVAGRDDLRPGNVPQQMEPAQRRAGKFLAHQPAADDAELHGLFHRHASISRRHCSIWPTSRSTIGSVTMSGSFVSATGRQLAL